MIKNKASFYSLILMLMWGINGWAQFNPQNPEEPSIQYKIELECTPTGIAELSGGGSYQYGSYVNIYTSPYNNNYEFQYWECNGEIYSRNREFMYMISTRDVKFIAHYKYQPYDPEEPNAHFKRRLFLRSQPEGVATFNISNGERFEVGSDIGIYETWSRFGYDFKGWYEDDKLISNSGNLNYTIPDRDVTLVAHYEFNPDTPDDPNSFYSTSCEFLAEPENIENGTVSVEGLDKGRAVFGSSITLNAIPIGENSFCGWYWEDSLLSVDPDYSFTVPSSSNRIHIVAIFKYKPHNLTYMYDGEIVDAFVYETGDSLSALPDMEKDGYIFEWQGLPEVMPDEDIVVTGLFRLAKIRISQPSFQLEGGEKQLIKAYAGSTNLEEVTDIIWTIANDNIATISNSGIVKGLSKGSTVVTATVKDNSQISASTSINVTSDNHKVNLPPVEFEFNYNAVNYDAENNRIVNDLEATLFDYNLQLTENIPEFSNGNKLSITNLCKGYIDKWDIGSLESGQYFNRTADDVLTIICKVQPRYDNSSNNSDLISVNSTSATNYSLRVGYKNAIYLASTNLYSDRYLNYKKDSDQIFAVRAREGKVVIQNLTTGESKVLNTNTWGSTNGSMNFFYSDASNYFTGDFFWAYLSKEYLSDSEIWDVVDYNENIDIDNIPDVTMGDANNSGVVNVTDISTVADFLFGNYPDIFNYKASDVNFNRIINVADITGIVDLIYGNNIHSAPKRNSGITNENGVGLSLSQITPGSEAFIDIDISNNPEISAIEMNIILPNGLTVVDSEMDSNRGAGNRVFRGGYVDETYKLMTYSLENETLFGNEGKLFTVKVKASEDIVPSTYDINLSNIVFSGNGEEIRIQPLSQSFIVEDNDLIASRLNNAIEIKIYDLLGREVESKSAKKGAYIMRESINGNVIRTYKVIR